MARTVELGDYQAMQRGAADDAPTIADHLAGLGVERECTAEMSLHMITERVRDAARERLPVDYAPTENDVVLEAERIWDGFSDNRKGPRGDTGLTRARIYDVDADGKVSDWRRPDTTPDRGPDVGTTVHQVSDDEPRFSGAGLANTAVSGAVDMIPSAAKFGTAPYIGAPTIDEMAERLIDEKEQLSDLADLKIVYRWKAKGGTSKGRPKLGGIERIAGQSLAIIEGPAPDLLVWLAADTLRESSVTERQIEAILFDQLVSVEWSDGDEDGDPTWRLVGPEVVCHLATLEEYGPFTHKLESARKALIQPSLFDGSVIGERFTDEEAQRVITMAAAAHARQVAGDGAGTLIHADGTPLTDDEIAELERRELADDDDVALGDCSICGKPIEPGQVVSHLFTAEGEVRRHMACRYDASDSGASDEDDDDILADPAVI